VGIPQAQFVPQPVREFGRWRAQLGFGTLRRDVGPLRRRVIRGREGIQISEEQALAQVGVSRQVPCLQQPVLFGQVIQVRSNETARATGRTDLGHDRAPFLAVPGFRQHQSLGCQDWLLPRQQAITPVRCRCMGHAHAVEKLAEALCRLPIALGQHEQFRAALVEESGNGLELVVDGVVEIQGQNAHVGC